jgi:hypothetical protein
VLESQRRLSNCEDEELELELRRGMEEFEGDASHAMERSASQVRCLFEACPMCSHVFPLLT